MNQLVSSIFQLKVYKQRDFDTEFRFHTVQTELYDLSISIIPPNYDDHDTLFVPIRMFETNFEAESVSTCEFGLSPAPQARLLWLG